jgi:hemolysin III
LPRGRVSKRAKGNFGVAQVSRPGYDPCIVRAEVAPMVNAPVKPLGRGVSHQFGFFVALLGTALLVHMAGSTGAKVASGVFGASLSVLLGTSALYHRPNWGVVGRARMRRMDHAAIFLLIAGGWTPVLWLVPPVASGHRVLAMIWGAAVLGMAKSMAWPNAPKWLTALLCVGLGWAGVIEIAARASQLPPPTITLLITAGVFYSVGAAIYALKRPNPFPRVFGYHEVFHALVLLASGCLFAHVVILLRHFG